MSKVIVGLETLDTLFARARDVARRADAGEVLPEADYHLNFASAAQLFGELTPQRLRLLEVLQATGAQSVYALAKRLKRSYSNVQRDVQKLLEHDLIARNDAGKVWVPWEAVELRLTLGSHQAAA